MQWGLLVYSSLILVLIVAILAVSYATGERNRARASREPYESGMPPTGTARLRLRASYYLVAMLFVVFDLEAAFIYAWAVSMRSTGWSGYFEILLFVAILAVGLVYLWRAGALDWGSSARKRYWRSEPADGGKADGGEAEEEGPP
jgi:NADH-quinone oxidoreductase subunit A